MASTLQKLLSTLLFFSTILRFQGSSTAQECPYPCFPPPTGPGNNQPVTTTPPAPPAGGTVYPPPSFYNPPAGGVYPYLTPPGGDGGGSGVAQPPPEPIVPWFPYYFRKPPHPDLSSSPALQGSLKKTGTIIAISFLVIFSLSSCSVLY